MISTNAFAPREIFKNPLVFNDFHGFVILKCLKFRSQKSLKNHSKSFPNRLKIDPETGSKNTFKKHGKKCSQLPSKWLQNPSKSKPDEPKTIPRRPWASPGCPRPPQTRPRPPFGPISASILMNFVPKTDAQRPKKQNKAKYFHQASDFDGKKL